MYPFKTPNDIVRVYIILITNSNTWIVKRTWHKIKNLKVFPIFQKLQKVLQFLSLKKTWIVLAMATTIRNEETKQSFLTLERSYNDAIQSKQVSFSII